jgi:hypothetical protein
MKRIPLFGTGLLANSAVISRQRRLNCFFELRQDGDKSQVIIRGTPGMVTVATLPDAPIRGWRVVANVLYVVAGLSLCKVLQNLSVTIIGSFDVNSTANVGISDNGVQLLIVDGVAGYIYTIVTGSYAQSALNAAGSFGKITDANFPNGATSCTFMDSRLIVNKPNTRQFYVSESYDGTGWTNVYSLPTFGTKENNSDLLVSVSAMNGVLTLFGNQSTEFWQNVGSTPLPFARISGATRNIGLAAPYSIAFIDDIQLFLGQNLYGGYSEVNLLQGFNMTRVSTDDIEHIIGNLPGHVWQDAVAFGYMLDGHKMYQITFPSADKSLLYDISSNLWSDLQSGVGLTGRHVAQFGITFNSLNYASDSTTGNIYKLDDEITTDNGLPIKRQLTTRHINMDGNRFGIDELYLDMETGGTTIYGQVGGGVQSGQGSDPQIMLQVSKDNGRTFGIERWKPIGKVGQYKSPRVMWNRLGASQDFVFQFTMTDPVLFVVIGGAVKIRQQEGMEG